MSLSGAPLHERILDLAARPVRDFSFQRFRLGGVELELYSDDELLSSEIAKTLGPPDVADGPPVSTRAIVHAFAGGSDFSYGLLRIDADPAALTPDDLILGLESNDFPFRRCATPEPGWIGFSYLDDREPLFWFRGVDCIFHKRDRWRAAIGFLLLHRIYRLRPDAIFFHAATVAVSDGGVMFVGPKGAGKSTTSLALAARGFPLLGDETACYVPATGTLEPFLRPVGIKPGPRSRVVHEKLIEAGLEPGDQIVRVDVGKFLAMSRAHPVPLRAIVFLDGFAAEPQLREIVGGRKELAALQPVVSSLVSAPRTTRVFQMARMLSSAMIFRLRPGDPDQTSSLVASVMENRFV